MAVLESFLIGLAANAAWGITTVGASRALDAIRNSRPTLENEIETAATTGMGNELPELLSGALKVAANSGVVEIDGALLTAVRSATLDHQNGLIIFGGSRISAPILITGGSHGASGMTEIGGNTSLRSQGTEIRVGQGASIKISGNAQIRQN